MTSGGSDHGLAAAFERQRRWRRRLDALAAGERRAVLAERVLEMARTARRHSPFYAELYGSTDHSSLATIPVLDRGYLDEHQDALLAASGITAQGAARYFAQPFELGSRYNAQRLLFSSSGSSGRRKAIVYALADFARSIESFQYRALGGGDRDRVPERLLYIGLMDRHNGGNAWMYHLRALMSVEFGDVFADPDTLLDLVAGYQPDAVLTRPHILTALGERAAVRGIPLPRAHLISVGEGISRAQAADITRYWGSLPHNSYSTVETGPLGYQPDPRVPELEIYDDLSLVELLTDDDRPILVPETPGRVVVSTLYAETLPMLRYEVGDYAMWRDTSLTRLSFPLGRTGTVVVRGRAGTVEVPESDLGSLAVTGVRQYQIRQLEPDSFAVAYEEAAGSDRVRVGQALLVAVREQLVAPGGVPGRVTLDDRPPVLDPVTGKVKRVVKLPPR